MSKKTTSQELAKLLISHEEAGVKIKDRINKGKQLMARTIGSEAEYDTLKLDSERWDKFNSEMLIRMFSTVSLAKEYSQLIGGVYHGNSSWRDWTKDKKEDIELKINRLITVEEKLVLIPDNTTGQKTNVIFKRETSQSKIFVVHGHDEEVKQTVARYLEKLSLIPVILHEQTNGGKTIIEKFEHHSDVDFAVVLLTPDDTGYSNQKPEQMSARARQNVILELGYFMGKLSRKHVCALVKNGVEVPSDIQGIIYIPYDDAGGWRFLLAKEMREAGINVDFNSL